MQLRLKIEIFISFVSKLETTKGKVRTKATKSTKLGPWLFILMTNDLHRSGSDVWKYVDDTTLAEVVPSGGQSEMQVAVNEKLVIDFNFDAVTVNS